MRLLLRQQRIKSWQMRAVSLRHQTESHGSGEHTKQNQIDPATCFFKYCAAQAAAPRRRLSLRSGRPSAPSPPKEPCKLYKIATQVPLHTSCSPSSLRRNVETQGGASRHRGSPLDSGAARGTKAPDDAQPRRLHHGRCSPETHPIANKRSERGQPSATSPPGRPSSNSNFHTPKDAAPS